MFRTIGFTVVLCLVSVGAQAALLGRAPLTPAGTNYRAYYDDVLDITWLANANLARSTYVFSTTPGFGTSFGVAGIKLGGPMRLVTATEWIAAVNDAAYLGSSEWRLPTGIGLGNDVCDFAYSGTECGYNVDVATGEMAHLFYNTLGNTAAVNSYGAPEPCASATPKLCLTNVGPFAGLVSNIYFYSPTENPFGTWVFGFQSGLQNIIGTDPYGYAWPVLNGDPFTPIPIPAAGWLFGGALGLLGVARRRAA